jgi:hypothetical protein
MIYVSELYGNGVQKRKKNLFSSISCFLIFILFFASSMDLVTCSFDHLCRELAEMEIEK